MYDKENNKITKEIAEFFGHGWKSYGDNTPMISFTTNNGYNGQNDHFLTVEQAVDLIDLLENLIAQAKNAKEHEDNYLTLDDTLF